MNEDLKKFLASRVEFTPEIELAFDNTIKSISSAQMVLAHKVYGVNEIPKFRSLFNFTVNDEGNIEITVKTSIETNFDNADFCDEKLKSLAFQFKLDGHTFCDNN